MMWAAKNCRAASPSSPAWLMTNCFHGKPQPDANFCVDSVCCRSSLLHVSRLKPFFFAFPSMTIYDFRGFSNPPKPLRFSSKFLGFLGAWSLPSGWLNPLHLWPEIPGIRCIRPVKSPNLWNDHQWIHPMELTIKCIVLLQGEAPKRYLLLV